MSALALLGGKPVRKELFPAHNPIGEEEKKAVMKVLDSGVLSQFLGAWHEDFYGGPKVRLFEEEFKKAVGSQYAVSVNSNTSGLYAAIGACGIGPGDEVIVSPYTMTASAVAPMIYGAVPVFADIDKDIFCLDPRSIEKQITPRTKAILIVHIFGHPADMDEIMAIARAHNLYVIEDCAQSPLVTYQGKKVGTIGDIGVFSFNYHKHVHTGEGGMVVTNNEKFAERVQLIRNHAESCVDAKGTKDFSYPIGFNFRMTEIEAAIGIEQLKKLPKLLKEREQRAVYLSGVLKKFPGLTPPIVKQNSTHAYYLHAVKFDKHKVGVHRDTFVKALKAELPSAKLRETTPILGAGYVKPLYYQSIYHSKDAQFSYNDPRYKGNVSYVSGICPVVEKMHFEELFTHEYMKPTMSENDLKDVVRGFEKVYENIEELKEYGDKKSECRTV